MIKKYRTVPELVVVIFCFFWFVEALVFSGEANYIALFFMLLFAFQIKYRYNWLGVLLSVLLFLFSILFLLALVSEYNDFTIPSGKAIQLISVGMMLFFLMLLISSWMFYKYVVKEKLN